MRLFVVASALVASAFINIQSEARPKNLAADVDFADTGAAVQAVVTLQSDQLRSIKNKGYDVEVRFYSGERKSQEKRIMKRERPYFLNDSKQSFTLSPKEACPAPGNYWAKVALLVRKNVSNGNPDGDTAQEEYNPFDGEYAYVCENESSRPSKLSASYQYTLADRRDGMYHQLNLKTYLDDNQLDNIKRSGSKVELRLYSSRDGQSFRVGKNKTYYINNASDSHSYSIKELCGEMSTIWDQIFGKDVEASCRLSVVNDDGGRDGRYNEFRCDPVTITCVDN